MASINLRTLDVFWILSLQLNLKPFPSSNSFPILPLFSPISFKFFHPTISDAIPFFLRFRSRGLSLSLSFFLFSSLSLPCLSQSALVSYFEFFSLLLPVFVSFFPQTFLVSFFLINKIELEIRKGNEKEGKEKGDKERREGRERESRNLQSPVYTFNSFLFSFSGSNKYLPPRFVFTPPFLCTTHIPPGTFSKFQPCGKRKQKWVILKMGIKIETMDTHRMSIPRYASL